MGLGSGSPAWPCFAGDPDLARLAGEGAALLLIAANGMDVLWASPAAAQIIGAPPNAAGFTLTTGLAPIERLARLATESPPFVGARLERLRFVNGRQLHMVTAAARRGVMPDGAPAVLLTLAGQKGRPAILPPFLAEAPNAPPPVLESVVPETTAPALPARLRFTFRTDDEGRFTAIGDEFAGLLPAGFDLVGLRWSDALDRGVIDAEERVAPALEGRETFSALKTAWPSRAGVWLDVALSGTPVHDAAHGFAGFRGFGISARSDRPCPQPAAAETQDAPHTRDASLVTPATPSQPLRQDDAEGRLSKSEREAFRQIARALGAQVDDAPEPETHEPAEPAPETEAPLREAAASEAAPIAIHTTSLQKAIAAETVPHEDIVQADAGQEDILHARAPQDDTAQDNTVQDDIAPIPSPGDADAFETGALETGAADAQRAETDAPQTAMDAPSASADDAIEDGEFIEIDTSDIIALPSVALAAADHAHDDSLADNANRLIDRLPIGIVVSRGDVPIVMNRTMLDMVGYDDIDQFFEAGGLDAMFRGRSADQIGMAAKAGDIALSRRDGGVIAAEARMQTIAWGDLPATLMIFRKPAEDTDSASRATLEMELRMRENELAELHAVLDTATDGVVMLDGEGRIMAMNRSAEALFGYDQNEVAGEAFITLLAPESHAAAIDYLEGLRAGGVAAVLNDGRELLGRERQGGAIPLFTTLGRIGSERDPKYCLVMRDITPWKKAEADLTAAKRAAEIANAQKSDFLARMSHEIRTPMSAIMGFAEVMLDERFGPIGNERYRDYLKDMHNSGAHVISLINDLLDISKIEAGRADLTFTRLDLNAAATDATNLMQNEARRARVILRINLEDKLPAIVADDRSIRQIFLNLLSNAIKFSDAGGQVIVSTTLSERGEVVLRIRDTGIGMREEDIATALEPFRQVGTARRGGGTGLGLPLTKALVEANRAALSIRSAPDKGTLVEVIFPPNRVLAE